MPFTTSSGRIRDSIRCCCAESAMRKTLYTQYHYIELRERKIQHNTNMTKEDKIENYNREDLAEP